MKAEEICGIYLVQHQLDGRAYIGQATDIWDRWREHMRLLKLGGHHCLKFQNYFNKNGFKNLHFSILMRCDEKELAFWEKWWIKSLNAYKTGFNMTEGGDNPPVKTREPFTLRNADTGEELYFTTVKEAAKQLNLIETNISAVLNGHTNHTGGWFNLNGKRKPKYRTLIDPYGKKHTFWQPQIFARKFNLELTRIYSLLSKNCDVSSGGWHREDSDLNRRKKSEFKLAQGIFKKGYKLISPQGEIVEGKNISKFAADNNLPVWSIRRVVAGKIKEYNGWKKHENN